MPFASTLALHAALLVLATGARAAELAKVTLDVAGHKVVAEVAIEAEDRYRGLMHRFSLAPDHGMLFVWDKPQPLGFYMRNTTIPLSIAFLDAQGRVINIEDMQPLTTDTHWSRGLALYALEMRQGWFKQRGIGPGAMVKNLPPPAGR